MCGYAAKRCVLLVVIFCMLTGGYLTFESATLLFFLGDFCQFFLPLSCQKYQAKEGGLAPADLQANLQSQEKSRKDFSWAMVAVSSVLLWLWNL